MIRLGRKSSAIAVLSLMASSLVLISGGAAKAATYDPSDALVTLDDANPILHYQGAVTTPHAWAWGPDNADTWQLTIDTTAQCDALVRIKWFDAHATGDVYELRVAGDSHGTNPADGVTISDRTGEANLVLPDGTYDIVVDWQMYQGSEVLPDGGSYYDITFEISGCDNWGEITSPDDDTALLTGDILELSFDYYDDDYDHARWAVRYDPNASCGTGTVVGNLDGHADAWTRWDGATFAASFDTTGWAAGDYCFVVDPLNESDENQVREVEWFRIADGHINGGGQIIEPVGRKAKDSYKVSFTGELWRFGTTVECDWTVQFHNVSLDAYDKGGFSGSSCVVSTMDFPDNGADGVTNITVFGTFNGVPGYRVHIPMEDYSEPAGSDEQWQSDTIRFRLYQGDTELYDTNGGDFRPASNNSDTGRTELDRGNLQIDLRR